MPSPMSLQCQQRTFLFQDFAKFKIIPSRYKGSLHSDKKMGGWRDSLCFLPFPLPLFSYLPRGTLAFTLYRPLRSLCRNRSRLANGSKAFSCFSHQMYLIVFPSVKQKACHLRAHVMIAWWIVWSWNKILLTDDLWKSSLQFCDGKQLLWKN